LRVKWTVRARRELRAQREYIAREHSASAARIAKRVLRAVDRLRTYPHYGRAASWDSSGVFRELPVAGTPLVVVYEVDEANDAVILLRVVHGAQRRGPE
jgi:plasmid stabilization system protein ParE